VAATLSHPRSGAWKDRVLQLHRELIELIAESDDTLLTKFFDQGGLSEEEFRNRIHAAVRRQHFIPCSASRPRPMSALLTRKAQNFLFLLASNSFAWYCSRDTKMTNSYSGAISMKPSCPDHGSHLNTLGCRNADSSRGPAHPCSPRE
jgi:hypothetical protein